MDVDPLIWEKKFCVDPYFLKISHIQSQKKTDPAEKNLNIEKGEKFLESTFFRGWKPYSRLIKLRIRLHNLIFSHRNLIANTGKKYINLNEQNFT